MNIQLILSICQKLVSDPMNQFSYWQKQKLSISFKKKGDFLVCTHAIYYPNSQQRDYLFVYRKAISKQAFATTRWQLQFFFYFCSSYQGWDNPFRPEGELSHDAEEILRLWKDGKLKDFSLLLKASSSNNNSADMDKADEVDNTTTTTQ